LTSRAINDQRCQNKIHQTLFVGGDEHQYHPNDLQADAIGDHCTGGMQQCVKPIKRAIVSLAKFVPVFLKPAQGVGLIGVKRGAAARGIAPGRRF